MLLARDHGGWVGVMERFLDKTGTVVSVTMLGDVCVQFDSSVSTTMLRWNPLTFTKVVEDDAVISALACSVATMGPRIAPPQCIARPAASPLGAVVAAAGGAATRPVVPTAEEAETEERVRLLRQLRDIEFASEEFDLAATASERLGGGAAHRDTRLGYAVRGQGAVRHALPLDGAELSYPPSEDYVPSDVLSVEGRAESPPVESPPVESPFGDFYESIRQYPASVIGCHVAVHWRSVVHIGVVTVRSSFLLFPNFFCLLIYPFVSLFFCFVHLEGFNASNAMHAVRFVGSATRRYRLFDRSLWLLDRSVNTDIARFSMIRVARAADSPSSAAESVSLAEQSNESRSRRWRRSTHYR